MDSAVVEKYEIVGKVKAKPRSDGLVLAVFAIVEPLEEVSHLLWGDAIASVTHLNMNVVESVVCLYFQ